MHDPSSVGVGEPTAPDKQARWAASTTRWVQEGIITEDQARRIIELESTPAGSRSTLLAEVLGYLGAALMVAAIAALTGEQWSEIPFAGHVAIVAAATVVGVIGGAVSGRRPGAAFDRMASLLWFATVGGVAGLTALVASDGFDLTDEVTLVAVLAAASAVAVAFYVLHPRWLQLFAVVGTTAGLVAASLQLAGVESAPVYGFVLMAIGAGWVLQSSRPVLRPMSAATIAGAVVYFVGCLTLTNEWLVAGLVLIALGATALLVSSVFTRNTVHLVLGAIGLFQSLPSLAVELFGSSIGAPLALLLAGAVIILVALRVRRSDKPAADPLTSSGTSPPPAAGR